MSRITKSSIREHFRLLGSEYLIPKSRKEAEERGDPAFLSLDYYSPGRINKIDELEIKIAVSKTKGINGIDYIYDNFSVEIDEREKILYLILLWLD